MCNRYIVTVLVLVNKAKSESVGLGEMRLVLLMFLAVTPGSTVTLRPVPCTFNDMCLFKAISNVSKKVVEVSCDGVPFDRSPGNCFLRTNISSISGAAVHTPLTKHAL